MFDDLKGIANELKDAQNELGIDFQVHLTIETAGLVESWVNGFTWRELCGDTSLDQGDLCRLLRRTSEILMQIPQAVGVSPALAQTAYAAATMMDRFPVADEVATVIDEKITTTTTTVIPAGTGFDLNVINNVDLDIISDEEMLDEIDDVKSINTIDDLDALFGKAISSMSNNYKNNNNDDDEVNDISKLDLNYFGLDENIDILKEELLIEDDDSIQMDNNVEDKEEIDSGEDNVNQEGNITHHEDIHDDKTTKKVEQQNNDK
jgi:hypothetical protein